MRRRDEGLLYLSSLESRRFESVRECRFTRVLEFDNGKPCALVSLIPGVVSQDFNVPGGIDQFVIATRHNGASLSPVDRFPCFIHIAIPREGCDDGAEKISPDSVQVIAWGELYRTAEDAAQHKFG